MKKFIGRTTVLAMCAVMMIGLIGCSQNTSHVLPAIVYDGDGGITIEHVNNVEADYVLFEDSEEANSPRTRILLHDDYVQYGSVSWAWVIKSGDTALGWIEVQGGSWSDNNDRSKYSYGITYNGNKITEETLILIYLITDDISEDYVKNHITFTASVGNIEYSGLVDFDEDPYAILNYKLNLSGIKADDAKGLTLSFGIHE